MTGMGNSQGMLCIIDLPKGQGGRLIQKRSRLHRIIHWSAIAGAIALVMVVLLFVAVNTWPVLGANGADLLRGVIGNKAVAELEMAFNLAQDTLLRVKYQIGLVKPAADWETSLTIPLTLTPTISPIGTIPPPGGTKTPTGLLQTRIQVFPSTPPPTFTPTPFVWQPLDISPLGSAKGEGIWAPYIQDASGVTVAYRTFLQPDPDRPYTLVAIVAIDLNHTKLHFVLGTLEPASPDGPPRSGEMPKTDKVANVLLAAFNGGFKADHGHFGAMADGITALPPRDGLGTLAIYKNGEVRLGEWGMDLNMSPDMVAFRQNGPLVIRLGKINQRIYNNSPKDWGYTVNDVSPTIRTGIGLSEDGQTLFYFCGPSLSMEALAKAMLAAGAVNAIQLDINNYWSLFVKINTSGSKLVPEPLLPKLMVAYVDRYLWDSSRDFFYLTSNDR